LVNREQNGDNKKLLMIFF